MATLLYNCCWCAHSKGSLRGKLEEQPAKNRDFAPDLQAEQFGQIEANFDFAFEVGPLGQIAWVQPWAKVEPTSDPRLQVLREQLDGLQPS